MQLPKCPKCEHERFKMEPVTLISLSGGPRVLMFVMCENCSTAITALTKRQIDEEEIAASQRMAEES